MANRAVFLDRDGVLNQAIVRDGKPYPPQNPAEFVMEPEAFSVLSAFKFAGFRLFVVTNQPDVARGTTSLKTVEELNALLHAELPMLDCVYTCYHDDQDGCLCRKPLPGLFFQAQKDFDLDLPRSFMIGDRWRDIEAGQKAGCKTLWLNRHYQEKHPTHYNLEIASLTEALPFILGESHEYH